MPYNIYKLVFELTLSKVIYITPISHSITSSSKGKDTEGKLIHQKIRKGLLQ